jgi:hypothetical protein
VDQTHETRSRSATGLVPGARNGHARHTQTGAGQIAEKVHFQTFSSSGKRIGVSAVKGPTGRPISCDLGAQRPGINRQHFIVNPGERHALLTPLRGYSKKCTESQGGVIAHGDTKFAGAPEGGIYQRENGRIGKPGAIRPRQSPLLTDVSAGDDNSPPATLLSEPPTMSAQPPNKRRPRARGRKHEHVPTSGLLEGCLGDPLLANRRGE